MLNTSANWRTDRKQKEKEVKKQEYLANTTLVDSVRNLANTEHVFTQSQLETVTVESINTSLEVQI